MTTTTRILTPLEERQLAEPGTVVRARRGAVRSSDDRKVFTMTMFVLAALFALLQNPFWVPGGDSEVYIAIARNLATGQGYLFNGRPVGMVPPGWPLVMAGVLKLSPTFLALKLTAMLSMLVALGASYWICRRFVSPAMASAVLLVTGVLSHVYSLTFWLHSDALFFATSAVSLLLAMQIGEGRPLRWRLPLLLLLAAAAVFVRWAGLLNAPLLAAAILQGQTRPRLQRAWIVAAVVCLTIAVAFVGTKWGMKTFKSEPVEFENFALLPDAAAMMDDAPGAGAGDDSFVQGEYTLLTATGPDASYFARFAGWGTWFSYLLWQPLRLGSSWPPVWHVANVLGWLVIALLLPVAVRDARARSWLIPAVMLYCLALCLNWTHATARYLVPLTPLIVLGAWRGAALLRQALNNPSHRPVFHWIWMHGVASVLVVNLLLYITDVTVMRSGDFYSRYEAGLNKSLLSASQYLTHLGVGHGQVVVNPLYINMGRKRNSPTGLRGLTMLTGRALRTTPAEFRGKALPRDRDFRAWLSENKVTYYLDQPPVSPWRIWHFRAGWIQELRSGEKAEDTGGGWRLYRCDGKSIPLRVSLEDPMEYPTRVPGL